MPTLAPVATTAAELESLGWTRLKDELEKRELPSNGTTTMLAEVRAPPAGGLALSGSLVARWQLAQASSFCLARGARAPRTRRRPPPSSSLRRELHLSLSLSSSLSRLADG